MLTYIVTQWKQDTWSLLIDKVATINSRCWCYVTVYDNWLL